MSDMPLTQYECKRCKRTITIDNIASTFVKTQTAIETEIPIAILIIKVMCFCGLLWTLSGCS